MKFAFVGALFSFLLLAGCGPALERQQKAAKMPLSDGLKRDMAARRMSPADPIMVRIFKEEGILEVWKRAPTGRYALLRDYKICRWSGKLGPKYAEGDRQAPEGFYEVSRGLMNPWSDYHLAFNLGFPNTFDRSHGRSGSHLMVHGSCSSQGCYAMTDHQIEEIYALAREAFKGGQRSFQVQAFPFQMTSENLAKHASSPHIDFWRMLKRGSDHFEISRIPPKIDVCEKKYIFNANAADPTARFHSNAVCPKYYVQAGLQREVEKRSVQDSQLIAAMNGKPLLDEAIAERGISKQAAQTSRSDVKASHLRITAARAILTPKKNPKTP